jgi:hypothetical protein
VFPSPTQRIDQKVPNNSQEGGDVMFLGFLLCAKYELNNDIFVKGKDKGC